MSLHSSMADFVAKGLFSLNVYTGVKETLNKTRISGNVRAFHFFHQKV